MWRNRRGSLKGSTGTPPPELQRCGSGLSDPFGEETQQQSAPPPPFVAQEQNPRNHMQRTGSSMALSGDQSGGFSLRRSLTRSLSRDGLQRPERRISRKQRRRSSIGSSQKAAALALQFSCSADHLEGFVQPDRMPFVAKSDLPTSAVIGALEIKAGKVLGQGDYTVTKEIKGFKFAKQRLLAAGIHPIFTQADESQSVADDKHHYYSLKTIKPLEPDNPLDAPPQSAATLAEAYQTAAQRLIQETLYLAALSAEAKPCPFLLPFRGFWVSDGEAFDQHQLDACHLVTDRLGETLQERMKTWKYHRHRAQRRKSTSSKKFIVQSVQMDLNTPEARSLLMHKSKRPKSTNPPPQIHAESLSRSRHKMLLQLPKLEQYPDDLVALQTNYVLQIAHALEFLHERGIVVRDLRPNTIGFKEYPNHHQIQLFHFGHCRELSQDGWIEPEGISAFSTNLQCNNPQHSSTSERDSQTSQDISADNSQQFRLDNSQQFKLRDSSTSTSGSPRAEAKHYRAPESYPLVPAPPPRGDPNNNLLLLMAQQDSLHKIHTGGTTVTRTHNNITCVTRTLMRNNTPAEEDGYKYEQGYNCKADMYSLMMIYFEMLAEAKPFGKSAITREGHYYRVQSHGLRPSLNKHHFPRTIKAVLEGGWNPDIQQRSSAKQVRQLLTTILPMLEGKGLPIRKKTTSSLPSRAAALLVPHNEGNGWGSVWSQTRSSRKLDSNQVMATIQAHRVNRDKKKDAQNEHLLDIEGKKSKKKRNKEDNKPVVQKTWRDYLPTLRKGMVESELNDRTAKILLGESVYNDKKQRQETSKAFKKAYC